MTKVVMIRHSEPNYEFVQARNFVGHGVDLAQLSEAGIQLAEDVSFDARLAESEIIVSSPYTRALQTAAIISKNRSMNISIELNLHEWIPDLSFKFAEFEQVKRAVELCEKNQGVCPPDCEITFENLENVFNRVKKCLLNYTNYKKIIVVTHGMVMHQFTSEPLILPQYCAIQEFDFDEHFKWRGFSVR